MFEKLIMQDAIKPECAANLSYYCFDFVFNNPATLALLLVILAAIGVGIFALIRRSRIRKMRSPRPMG